MAEALIQNGLKLKCQINILFLAHLSQRVKLTFSHFVISLKLGRQILTKFGMHDHEDNGLQSTNGGGLRLTMRQKRVKLGQTSKYSPKLQ